MVNVGPLTETTMNLDGREELEWAMWQEGKETRVVLRNGRYHQIRIGLL